MLIGYLLIINAVALLLMRADKRRAIKSQRRIRESTFMTLAALGGAPGVICGMYAFRHKTKHAKFTILVPVILAAQILLCVVILSHLQ